MEAGLCHGAGGVGHLYHRLYRTTGDARLKAIARRWFAHALELRRPGTGVAGYAPPPPPGSESEAETRVVDQNDSSLITGAAGIGLALLSAISPVAPAWDRIFLMDLPLPTPGGQRKNPIGLPGCRQGDSRGMTANLAAVGAAVELEQQ